MKPMNDTLLQAKEPEMKADAMNRVELENIAGGGGKLDMGWYCNYCGKYNQGLGYSVCHWCGKHR